MLLPIVAQAGPSPGKGAATKQITEGHNVPINMSKDNSIPADADGCYETVASQEEIYLEETEEEVRAILTSNDQSPSQPTAQYWRSKIEEIELDWEVEKFDDQC
jgi:hypothetical protein